MKNNGKPSATFGQSPPSLIAGILLLGVFVFLLVIYALTIQNLNNHTQNNAHILARFLLGAMGVIGILGVLWLWEDRIRKDQQKLLQESYQHSLLTIEAERGNLARELHDTVAQELAALKIILYQIPVLPEVKDRLHGILDRAQGQLRQVALGLRPPLLDTLGLLEALKYLSDTFTLRSGIQVSLLISSGDSTLIKGDRAMNLYRVVQEALMNAWKHSHALRVNIQGRFESEKLFLDISDNGTGMDKDAWESLESTSNFGLAGMKERIQLLGGCFTFTSTKGSGTVIRLEVPV